MSAMPTSSSMSMASSSATAPANSCRSSCRRSRIGSRRSDLAVSASDALTSAGDRPKEIASARARSARSPRELPPELLVAKVFEFLAASRAEILQKVDRAVVHHVPKLDKGLFRLQIRVQDSPGNMFRARHHSIGRQHPHSAELRIETDQTWNIGFIVLERIDV